jgi:hypothetical protein
LLGGGVLFPVLRLRSIQNLPIPPGVCGTLGSSMSCSLLLDSELFAWRKLAAVVAQILETA